MKSIFADEPEIEMASGDPALTEVGILVVDEDPAFQLGLKTFLKEYIGFEQVFTAKSGREALELIEKEESIELLTVDYQMPEMDGLELLAHLEKSAPRPLGVTMITSFPSDQLKADFAALSSSRLLTHHFLAKPVEFEKLEPVIIESYEELKRSRQLTETFTGEPESGEPIDPAALAEIKREWLAKIESLEERLEATTRDLREVNHGQSARSFWLDVLKLVIFGLIALVFWQIGFVTQLNQRIEGVKNRLFPPAQTQVIDTAKEIKPS